MDSKYVKKQRIFIERVHILRRSSEKMLTYEVEPLGTRKISIPEIPIDDIISISLEEVRKDYYKNDFELFLENLPFEFGIGTCEKNQINISHDEIDHDPRFGPWYAFTSHAFKLEKNLSDRNWKIILDFSITKKSSSWPLDVPLLKLIVLPSHISPRDERLTRFIPSDFCWEDVDQNTVTITDSSSTSTNQNQCINGPEALGQDFVPQEFTDLFNTDSLEIEDGEKPTIQTGFSKKLSRSPTIPDNLETMGSSSDVCDQEKPENSTESSSTIISKANDRVPNQVIPKKVRFAPILETFFPEIPDSSTSSASHTDNSELQVSPSGARKVSSSNTLDTPPSSTLEKLPSKAGQELSSVVEASPFTIVEASKNLATTTSSSSDEKDQASVPKSVSRENLSPCAIDRLESPLIFVGNASTIEKNPGHSSKSSREELSNLALLMEAQVNQVSIYDCSLSEGCEEFFSGAFNSVESDGTTGSPSAVRSSSGENGIEIKLSNLTL